MMRDMATSILSVAPDLADPVELPTVLVLSPSTLAAAVHAPAIHHRPDRRASRP
jgi:hypothetical protein